MVYVLLFPPPFPLGAFPLPFFPLFSPLQKRKYVPPFLLFSHTPLLLDFLFHSSIWVLKLFFRERHRRKLCFRAFPPLPLCGGGSFFLLEPHFVPLFLDFLSFSFGIPGLSFVAGPPIFNVGLLEPPTQTSYDASLYLPQFPPSASLFPPPHQFGGCSLVRPGFFFPPPAISTQFPPAPPAQAHFSHPSGSCTEAFPLEDFIS